MDQCKSLATQTLSQADARSATEVTISNNHLNPESYLEGDNIASRYQRTKQTLEYLKARLRAEREQLALERSHTSSLYMISSHPNFNLMGRNVSPLNYSLSTPDRIIQLDRTPVYDGFNSGGHRQQKHTQTPKLKEHINTIEKMCDLELKRMEKSIANLRKVKRFWNNVDFQKPFPEYKVKPNEKHEFEKHTENIDRNKKGAPLSSIAFYEPQQRLHENQKYKYIRSHRIPHLILEEDISEQRRQYLKNCRRQINLLKTHNFFQNESHLFSRSR